MYDDFNGAARTWCVPVGGIELEGRDNKNYTTPVNTNRTYGRGVQYECQEGKYQSWNELVSGCLVCPELPCTSLLPAPDLLPHLAAQRAFRLHHERVLLRFGAVAAAQLRPFLFIHLPNLTHCRVTLARLTGPLRQVTITL